MPKLATEAQSRREKTDQNWSEMLMKLPPIDFIPLCVSSSQCLSVANQFFSSLPGSNAKDMHARVELCSAKE